MNPYQNKVTVSRVTEFDNPDEVDNYYIDDKGDRKIFEKSDCVSFSELETHLTTTETNSYRLDLEGNREKVDADCFGSASTPLNKVKDKKPSKRDIAVAAEMEVFDADGEVVRSMMTDIVGVEGCTRVSIIESEADLPTVEKRYDESQVKE